MRVCSHRNVYPIERDANGKAKRCPVCTSLHNQNRVLYFAEYRKLNKEKCSAASKKCVVANPEKYRADRLANKKKNAEKNKEYNARWRQENRDRIKEVNALWYKNNIDIANARWAKYEASKLNRTPKWLTKEHLEQIKAFYMHAAAASKALETQIDVDHIIPLQGKEVSGLHVPWNLQLLPHIDNVSKGNRLKKVA